MNKKELLKPLENANGWMICADYDWQKEIRRLIESSGEIEPQEVVELKLSDEDKFRIEKKVAEFKATHGGKAGVGDEERKRLIKWVESLSKGIKGLDIHQDQSYLYKIIALIRQLKRTVSREQVAEWAAELYDHAYVINVEANLNRILAELGFTVEG